MSWLLFIYRVDNVRFRFIKKYYLIPTILITKNYCYYVLIIVINV